MAQKGQTLPIVFAYSIVLDISCVTVQGCGIQSFCA